MGGPTISTFSCPDCGRRYPWRAQLAGKRAKCACGATLSVPATDPAADADGPSAEDLYDLAPPPVSAAPARPSPAAAAALTSAVPAGAAAAPVGYRSAPTERERRADDRFSFDRLTHPPRDLYIPVGLLIAGFLAFVVWAAVYAGAGSVGAAFVALVMGLTTLVKTVVLTLLALLIAPRLGISFGDLRTAVLKFAAILIFTDAAALWLDVIMDSLGAGNPVGRSGRRGHWIAHLLLAVALVSVLSHYLFDMDREETGMFALPLALLSKFINFILRILLIAVLGATLRGGGGGGGGAGPAAAPNAGPGSAGVANTGGAAPSGATPPAVAPPVPDPRSPADRERDQAIDQRITRTVLVREAREWETTRLTGRKLEAIEHLYNAGAAKVYVDLEGARRPGQPSRLYVVLPPEPDARAACITAATEVATAGNLTTEPQPLTDRGQQYVVIHLKQ